MSAYDVIHTSTDKAIDKKYGKIPNMKTQNKMPMKMMTSSKVMTKSMPMHKEMGKKMK